MTKCRECYDDGYIWTHPSGSDNDKPRFEKCDACDILESDHAALAKANGRQYFLVWWNGFTCNIINGVDKPFSSEMRHEDINANNGWDDDDVEEISTLHVGDKHETGGPIERITVYRYA